LLQASAVKSAQQFKKEKDKLKITTWNVNGLRAALRKGAADWWDSARPDVLCLQEIRARPDQLTAGQREKLEQGHPEWNPAQRPGYSGVATFSQIKPSASIKGMGEERVVSLLGVADK